MPLRMRRTRPIFSTTKRRCVSRGGDVAPSGCVSAPVMSFSRTVGTGTACVAAVGLAAARSPPLVDTRATITAAATARPIAVMTSRLRGLMATSGSFAAAG